MRPIWRVLILWVASALLLVLLAWLFPGFDLADFWSALGAAAILGLLNALVWPLLVRFALPLTVLTLGLAPLFLNGATVLVVAWIVPGVTVDGFWWAFAVARRTDAARHGVQRRLCARGRRRRGLAPACGRTRTPAAATSRRAWCSCRSTGSHTLCCSARSATATHRPSPAGCSRARTT